MNAHSAGPPENEYLVLVETSKSPLTPFKVFFLALLLLFHRPAAQDSTLRSYPEGFSLRIPPRWEARIIDGRYIYVSPQEEGAGSGFILAYPFFLGEQTGSLSWLQSHLPEMTRFFTDLLIEKLSRIRTSPDESAARLFFRKGGRSYQGRALCSIQDKSGILYVIAAPQGEFENVKPALLAAVETFRFIRPREEEKAPQKSPRIEYASWLDPVENAFSLEVPRGWSIDGGTFRRSAVDFAQFLRAVSPDGAIDMRINDREIPAFTMPSPILAMTGFAEGSWYSPGYGVRMKVREYEPGRSFLKNYIRETVGSRVSGFEAVTENDRPDVVSNFNRIYGHLAVYGVSFTHHAGETAFRFRRGSLAYVGYGFAMTQVVRSTGAPGGIWSVPLLVLYTCPPEEADTVRRISDRMFQTVHVNPLWAASQQLRTSVVSHIVAQTHREITEIIDRSYWARQEIMESNLRRGRIMDGINRKFSNAILGVTDVVDPETGESWTVTGGHNYYWRKAYTNQVVGTDIYERPDIDFTPLREY